MAEGLALGSLLLTVHALQVDRVLLVEVQSLLQGHSLVLAAGVVRVTEY